MKAVVWVNQTLVGVSYRAKLKVLLFNVLPLQGLPDDFRLVQRVSATKGVAVAIVLCLLHLHRQELPFQRKKTLLLGRERVRLVSVGPVAALHAFVGLELVAAVHGDPVHLRNAKDRLALHKPAQERVGVVLDLCPFLRVDECIRQRKPRLNGRTALLAQVEPDGLEGLVEELALWIVTLQVGGQGRVKAAATVDVLLLFLEQAERKVLKGLAARRTVAKVLAIFETGIVGLVERLWTLPQRVCPVKNLLPTGR